MLTHTELLEAIRGFALLYLEIEAARRPGRTLAPYAAPDLALRLHHGERVSVPGTLRVGGVDYTVVGNTIRAAVTVHRGDDTGALLLTFRRLEEGMRLVSVEAPDRNLLVGP